MKVYKNQTFNNAKDLGFYSNFSFASDEIMSPDGIDITPLSKDGKIVHYEITEYDKETKTAKISLMSEKEFKEWRESLIRVM